MEYKRGASTLRNCIEKAKRDLIRKVLETPFQRYMSIVILKNRFHEKFSYRILISTIIKNIEEKQKHQFLFEGKTFWAL